ncbi:MAG: hypothetical protein WDZ49_14855 [Litorilinea sp.]
MTTNNMRTESQNTESQNTESCDTNPAHERRSGFFWGAMMILIGIVVLGSQWFDLDEFWGQFGLYFMPLLGLVFIGWGIYNREPGFLIPGGVVSGIGAGILVTTGTWQGEPGVDTGGLFLICMALGFVSITVMTAIFTDETQWWGLIPGGIIGLVGLTTLYGGVFELTLVTIAQLWPVALIAGGIYVIYSVNRKR